MPCPKTTYGHSDLTVEPTKARNASPLLCIGTVRRGASFRHRWTTGLYAPAQEPSPAFPRMMPGPLARGGASCTGMATTGAACLFHTSALPILRACPQSPLPPETTYGLTASTSTLLPHLHRCRSPQVHHPPAFRPLRLCLPRAPGPGDTCYSTGMAAPGLNCRSPASIHMLLR